MADTLYDRAQDVQGRNLIVVLLVFAGGSLGMIWQPLAWAFLVAVIVVRCKTGSWRALARTGRLEREARMREKGELG